MKKSMLKIAAAVLLAASGAASADILYTFSATNLIESASQDFSFTLRFDHYVNDIGFHPVTAEQSNTLDALGFDIAYAGTYYDGAWGFDDAAHGATVGYGWMGFDGNSLQFNVNLPYRQITAPGVYEGIVSGNKNSSIFHGDASLTVLDTALPEPSAFALLGLGAAGLACARRRASRARLDRA